MLTVKEKDEIIKKVEKKCMRSTFGFIIKEDALDDILKEYILRTETQNDY